MNVPTLKEMLTTAAAEKYAIGHFNASTRDMMIAIAEAGVETDMPVLIGLSEGERDFVGIDEAVRLVASYREKGHRVYLNADHSYSLERVQAAVTAGVDAVIIDAAKLPIEENIALVKSCVDYVRSSGSAALVEAELGYIGQSSSLQDSLPSGVATPETMTSPEQAADFVSQTGVDLFAPSVGNVHGLIASGNPHLDIDRIAGISGAVASPLVLHGGSGITPEDFLAAIKAGIRIIHISTELRVAYKKAIETYFAEQKHDIAPYKYLGKAGAAMKDEVVKKIKLFSQDRIA